MNGDRLRRTASRFTLLGIVLGVGGLAMLKGYEPPAGREYTFSTGFIDGGATTAVINSPILIGVGYRLRRRAKQQEEEERYKNQ